MNTVSKTASASRGDTDTSCLPLGIHDGRCLENDSQRTGRIKSIGSSEVVERRRKRVAELMGFKEFWVGKDDEVGRQ